MFNIIVSFTAFIAAEPLTKSKDPISLQEFLCFSIHFSTPDVVAYISIELELTSDKVFGFILKAANIFAEVLLRQLTNDGLGLRE